MDGSPDNRALRASDADRDQVADVLRSAAADGRLTLAELQDRLEMLFEAKTYGELEPVVADLPGTLDVRRPVAAPSTSNAVSRVGGGRPVNRSAKAIFSGVARRGQWVVPSHYRVKAVFGGVDLDLRNARLEAHEVTIDAIAVFGGVNIVAPEDVVVLVDGIGIFGGFADQASDRQPPDGSPVVRVTGKAVFGGVNVERKPPKSAP